MPVPYLVPRHEKHSENPVPDRGFRAYAQFIGLAYVRGLKVIGPKIGVLTVLVGGSVLAYGRVALHWSWPWTLVAVLVALLVVFMLGAAALSSEWYSVAVRYAPTWQRLQQRADVLTAAYNAQQQLDSPQFKAWFAATHSVATQLSLDEAEQAGFPLNGITRDDIRNAELEDLPRIAVAFDKAASAFRVAEEEGKV